MRWSKSSDFLPLANAKAQVKFWEKDLWYAEQYLKYVVSFKNRNWKGYDKVLKIAQADVELSKNQLALAKIKLKESESLE